MKRNILELQASANRCKSLADVVSSPLVGEGEYSVGSLRVFPPLTLDHLSGQLVQMHDSPFAVFCLRQH
jgi:hypothetical protein